MISLKINHVTLLVTDKDKAEYFYTQILGLEKINVKSFLWIKVGQQYIHLTNSQGTPVKNTFTHFAIDVKNLKGELPKLVAKGAEIFEVDAFNNKIMVNTEFENPTRHFFINDPDGNLIELLDEGSLY